MEDFWSRVPLGATVEIWAYDSRSGAGDDQPGQTELYFVNDSDTVHGIGFHVDGAVYEGT